MNLWNEPYCVKCYYTEFYPKYIIMHELNRLFNLIIRKFENNSKNTTKSSCFKELHFVNYHT